MLLSVFRVSSGRSLLPHCRDIVFLTTLLTGAAQKNADDHHIATQRALDIKIANHARVSAEAEAARTEVQQTRDRVSPIPTRPVPLPFPCPPPCCADPPS